MSLEELRQSRKKQQEDFQTCESWTCDLVKGTDTNTSDGWMSNKKLLELEDVLDNNHSRRLVVREYREHLDDGAGGKRSNIDDHFSEGDVHMATWCFRNCKVDGVDVFRRVRRWCMTAGMVLSMLKRYIKSAFRRVPIQPDQHWTTGVVWSMEG